MTRCSCRCGRRARRCRGIPRPCQSSPGSTSRSGSLGQGLAVGLGMALAMRIDGIDANVWVMLGDSEMAEGSVWEAMEADLLPRGRQA